MFGNRLLFINSSHLNRPTSSYLILDKNRVICFVKDDDYKHHTGVILMFRALNKENNKSIVSIDPNWIDNKVELKQLCKSDKIICPWCLESVNFKSGEQKRSHFAHKVLKNCPYSKESPIILEARATLYDWLIQKTQHKSGWSIEVEVEIHENTKKKIDCLVRTQTTCFAYIIIEKTLSLDDRECLNAFIRNNSWKLIVIFAMEMHKLSHIENSVALTTVERQYIFHSCYDYSSDESVDYLGSLFYLDGKDKDMLVTRRLERIHAPQIFEGEYFKKPLNDALLSPQTGEFVLPGEHELLQKELEQAALEEKLQRDRIEKKREQDLRKAHELLKQRPLFNPPNRPNKSNSLSIKKPSKIKSPAFLKCQYCGKVTNDWWFKDPETGTCKCQECSRRNRSKS